MSERYWKFSGCIYLHDQKLGENVLASTRMAVSKPDRGHPVHIDSEVKSTYITWKWLLKNISSTTVFIVASCAWPATQNEMIWGPQIRLIHRLTISAPLIFSPRIKFVGIWRDCRKKIYISVPWGWRRAYCVFRCYLLSKHYMKPIRSDSVHYICFRRR